MNLISWNYRRLGALHAVRELTKMVNRYKPQILFLMETKRRSNGMEWLRLKWKFDKCFTVEGMARGEGLALLWIKELKAEVRSYSRYHIDVRIEEVKKGRAWSFIGFYENPKTSKCQCSWEIL